MVQTLDEFFASNDWDMLEAATGWKVVRDAKNPQLVRLYLEAKKDGDKYIVLFVCDGYPTTAPGAAFINEEGSKADAKAWPTGTPEFLSEVKPPPNSFFCMPWTREGLTHHKEWRTNAAVDPWNGDRHTLMDLFNRMQRILNGPYYTGRGSS
jgi:hypothetical protein